MAWGRRSAPFPGSGARGPPEGARGLRGGLRGGLFLKSWVAPSGRSPRLPTLPWGAGGGERAGAGSPAMAREGPGQVGNSQNNAS